MTIEDVKKLINTKDEYKIYKSREFLLVKAEVMAEFHGECARCKSRGIITPAQTVHHINYVKTHPELAFCKYYTDKYGRWKRNLIPLCNDCHNAVHKRFNYAKKKKEKLLTEEKW